MTVSDMSWLIPHFKTVDINLLVLNNQQYWLKLIPVATILSRIIYATHAASFWLFDS